MTAKCTYCTYFLVGSMVGIAAVLAREFIGFLLPADTSAFYLLSVMIVYMAAMIASFYGHFQVTFSHVGNKRATSLSMGRFVLIALVGMGITSMSSYLIRYNFDLETVFGKLLPAFAFAMGAIVASAFTFALNARYTFIATGPGTDIVRNK